jgi:hypothetical protein
MKRTALFGLLLCLAVPVLRADDISDNMAANLNDAALDALAKDLGAAVGGGSFHHGKALGFPLGFDLGVQVPVLKLKDEDVILRDNDNKLTATWGQLEVGLPARINLIGRVGKVFDADMIGGGVRVGVLNSSVPGIPSISVSALYSELDHDYFDMKTISGNAVVSFELPFIDPFLGVGYDSSKLEPTDQAFVGVAPTVSRSVEGKAHGSRVELGINLHVIPFTYLTLAGGLANGESLYHGGLGVRF